MRFLSIISILLIVGCATVGRKIDQAAVDKIQKGVSTREDVRGLVGSPDHVSREAGGDETWSYIYIRSAVKGESFIPIVGAFAGGVNTQQQSVAVVFGQDGKVSKVISNYGGTSLDEGLSAGGKPRLENEKGKRQK
jgi:outer membrane protein assembly factor BamE (lipoprotein component of BamABCDE complex)